MATFRSMLVVAALAALTACGPAARPYTPTVAIPGHGWWCTGDQGGGVSACSRTEESCGQARRNLQKSTQFTTLTECAAQPRAYCFATDAANIADQCHMGEHTCELGRSRMVQAGYSVTACGVVD